MCGRYASTASAGDLSQLFGATNEAGDVLSADYNVAPTKDVPVVVVRPGGDGELARRLRMVRWGLVPHWSKNPAGAAKMINARAETVAGKPAFRAALAARRCLVPAEGWYEWEKLADGRRRQPWFIHRDDGQPLAFAGLYEVWRDAAGQPLATCTIVTAPAPAAIAHIHDRAPVPLSPAAWEQWLDPSRRDPRAACGLLVPAPPGSVAAYRVGPDVGNVRNNSPALLAPTAPTKTTGLFDLDQPAPVIPAAPGRPGRTSR